MRPGQLAQDDPQRALTEDYLEGLLEGFVAYDRDWRMTYMNAAAERLLGRRRQELLAKTWHEAFPHAVGSPVDEMYQRVKRTGKAERMEYDYRRQYGKWLEISAVPVQGGGLGVYFRDITDRVTLYRALEESEARYRAIVESQTEMVCRFRVDGTILFANGAYARARGQTPESMAGRSFWDFIPPADHAGVRQMLARLTPESPELRIENRFETMEGVRWTLWANRGLAFDDAGRVLEAQSTGIDITERKRAEEALREADRRKDEFLATLAHELRNPLAPISTGLHLLRLAPPGSPEALQAQTMMERQLGILVRLVDDLLEVSRISRGSIALRRERLDLAAAVRAAVETSRPAIEAGRHHLEVQLPAQPVMVDADLVRVAQVISNLLHNAAKYTEPDGRIWLTVLSEGGEAVISVRDNGAGFTAEMKPRLFQLFSQADSTLHRSQGGLGIGLSLARRLVELHGGAIEADSAGTGKGSEFVVRLPLAGA